MVSQVPQSLLSPAMVIRGGRPATLRRGRDWARSCTRPPRNSSTAACSSAPSSRPQSGARAAHSPPARPGQGHGGEEVHGLAADRTCVRGCPELVQEGGVCSVRGGLAAVPRGVPGQRQQPRHEGRGAEAGEAGLPGLQRRAHQLQRARGRGRGRGAELGQEAGAGGHQWQQRQGQHSAGPHIVTFICNV